MTNENQALQTQNKEPDQLKRMLEQALPAMRKIAGKYLQPERLVKIALVARAKNPVLAQCTPPSLLNAIMEAVQVGLEPNTPLQHAALVPFKNKHTKQMECQFMPMYKGLIDLARRSCGLKSCRARPVHEHDYVELDEGLEPQLVHRPMLNGERGDVIWVYAIAEMREDTRVFDWMTVDEIRSIQARAKSQTGPWSTDWGEMAKKTVIKRLLKQLPMSDELAQAVEVDDDDYRDGGSISFDLPPMASSEPVDRGDAIADKVKKGRKPKPKKDPQGDLIQ